MTLFLCITISNCIDGLDYESGSGGVLSECLIRYNTGDGVDFDGQVDIIIDNNTIVNKNDYGIETR